MSKIVPDKPTDKIATANRKAIESGLAGGGTVHLPAGTVYVDQAPLVGQDCSGGTLAGAGMGRTILRNIGETASGRNRSLLIQGTGFGYVHYADDRDGSPFDGPTVTLLPWDGVGEGGFDPADWAVGRVVWGFRWNGFWTQNPPPRVRYVVKAVDAATRRVTFDQPAAPDLTAFKWCDGSPIKDVPAGADAVQLDQPADAETFTPGEWVAVSSGPVIANEAVSDYRRVVAVDRLPGTVYLDRPLARAHTGAALVRVKPASGFAVRDLTIARPVNTAAEPLLAKFCTDLRLDRVRFGVPGEPASDAAIAASGYVVLSDCEAAAPTGLTAVHDLSVRGGRLGGVAMEEGCSGVTLAGVLLAACRGSHGVHAHLGCERIHVWGCRIEGFGYDAGGGNGSPLAIDATDSSILNVTTAGTNPATDNYVGGDNLRIANLVTDVGVVLNSGRGVRLQDSRVRWWAFHDGAEGKASNCEPAAAVPGGWKEQTATDGKAAA